MQDKTGIKNTVAYREGRETYEGWGSEKDCPYADNDPLHAQWFAGWFDAASEGGTL